MGSSSRIAPSWLSVDHATAWSRKARSAGFMSWRSAKTKEWAYAGLFFAFSGALYSHIANGDAIAETLPPMVPTALTAGSYLLRPADRRLVDLPAP